MKASKCLFNSATALRNVFINNAAVAWETPGQLQRLLLPAVTVAVQPVSPLRSRRAFSSQQVAQLKWSRPDRDTKNATAANDRGMRDYAIVYPWIQVRKDDGSLTEPQRTSAVLKKLDMDKHTLVLLAAPRADSSSKGPEYPICRIGDRRAEKAAEAEKKAALKKMPKIVTKEMELNWAIAPHDLRTRMTQLKKFLSKGCQVRVTMQNAKKRDKRKAGLDEAKEVLKAVVETVGSVPGAKETKPRDGNVGETLILVLHAPTGSVTSKADGAGTTATPAEAPTIPPAAADATDTAAAKPGVSEG